MENKRAILNGKMKPTRKPVVKEKNPAAVALGRLGGLKGGKARAKSLTAAQRKASAQIAAKARWTKTKTGAAKS